MLLVLNSNEQANAISTFSGSTVHEDEPRHFQPKNDLRFAFSHRFEIAPKPPPALTL